MGAYKKKVIATPLLVTSFLLPQLWDSSVLAQTPEANEIDTQTIDPRTEIDQKLLHYLKGYLYQQQEKVLIDAPHIKQMPELPRGCEVTSLAMLLQYAGVSVDKMTLAKQVKKVPFMDKGLKGNLHDGFVGNMYSFQQPGIGVYHRPIKELAETYLPGKVIDFTGKDFDAVITQLNLNRPVWVVVTSTFTIVPKKFWRTWKTKKGPLKITYKMHSVLVTGYDQQSIYVNDPLTMKNRRLPRQAFIAGWEQLGKQAITIDIP